MQERLSSTNRYDSKVSFYEGFMIDTCGLDLLLIHTNVIDTNHCH